MVEAYVRKITGGVKVAIVMIFIDGMGIEMQSTVLNTEKLEDILRKAADRVQDGYDRIIPPIVIS